jgi:hypothetical protein
LEVEQRVRCQVWGKGRGDLGFGDGDCAWWGEGWEGCLDGGRGEEGGEVVESVSRAWDGTAEGS